ncbi:MAG: Na+/H+ antiporter NhaA, partial [Acidimicrobiales bacterium]
MPSPSALSPPAKRSAAHRAGAAVAALRRDRAAGIALTTAAAAALVWANWPGAPRSYPDSWGAVAPWSSSVGLHLSFQGWVNQALLIAFFAVVGLEIRREFTAGEMRSVRRAAVPVVAALAGMILPALLYLAVLAGGRGSAA